MNIFTEENKNKLFTIYVEVNKNKINIVNKINKRLYSPIKTYSENNDYITLKLPGEYFVSLDYIRKTNQISKFEIDNISFPVSLINMINNYNEDIDYWLIINKPNYLLCDILYNNIINCIDIYFITNSSSEKIHSFIDEENKNVREKLKNTTTIRKLLGDFNSPHNYYSIVDSYNNIPIKLNKGEHLVKFPNKDNIRFDLNKLEFLSQPPVIFYKSLLESTETAKKDNWFKKLINIFK